MKYRSLMLTAFVLNSIASAWADYPTGYTAFQRGDYATAYRAWQPLAEHGMAKAQFNLGILYARGLGAPQNDTRAATWFHKAAQQNNVEAQFNLGILYAQGRGVTQDDGQAYLWLHLAARQGHANAVRGLEILARRMSPAQVAETQVLARAWQPQTSPTPLPPSADTADDVSEPPALQITGTGTGFIVSRQGHVLTNYHVIEACGALSARHGDTEHALTLVASDPRADLAVLEKGPLPTTLATFRTGKGIRPGDDVVVIGFPLRQLLASEAHVTTGTVSALAGLKNDARHLQISAPIQSGNSGGPLLDRSGNIVGVITSTLDALRVAEAFGDVPQNVNFAIKAGVAQQFLDRHNIPYQTAVSGTEHRPADIGEKALAFTLMVECWQ